MKRILTHVISFSIGLSAGLIVAGCASTRIKQLSGDEFLQEAKRTDQMNSFRWTSFIGSTHQGAYLESGYPAFIGRGMRTTVYWVPLSDLPSNIVNQLKSGTPPWTNWMNEISQPTNAPYFQPAPRVEKR